MNILWRIFSWLFGPRQNFSPLEIEAAGNATLIKIRGRKSRVRDAFHLLMPMVFGLILGLGLSSYFFKRGSSESGIERLVIASFLGILVLLFAGMVLLAVYYFAGTEEWRISHEQLDRTFSIGSYPIRAKRFAGYAITNIRPLTRSRKGGSVFSFPAFDYQNRTRRFAVEAALTDHEVQELVKILQKYFGQASSAQGYSG